MDSQRAIEQLMEQQARITALLEAADSLLAAERLDSFTALAALRWQLMRTMREYQLFKHQEIFDPLVASSNPRLAEMAFGMKRRCIAIGKAYAAHVELWSDGAATNEWATYTNNTRKIITKIREHLDRERIQTLTVLNGAGRIRQASDRVRQVSSL